MAVSGTKIMAEDINELLLSLRISNQNSLPTLTQVKKSGEEQQVVSFGTGFERVNNTINAIGVKDVGVNGSHDSIVITYQDNTTQTYEIISGGCKDCTGTCKGTCDGGCEQSCTRTCTGGCSGGCSGSCSGCSSSCRRDCSSDAGCCFPAGTKVLVYDDKQDKIKSINIEDIKVGDFLLGANGQLNEVYIPYKAILGDKRDIYTASDNSLNISGEHLIWCKQQDKEYWGVLNLNSYLLENQIIPEYNESLFKVRQYEIYKELNLNPRYISEGLIKSQPIVIYDKNVEFGTINGWKKVNFNINRNFKDDTIIYSAIVGGNHTYYANGYLVSGFATDSDYDYSQIKIDESKK